MADERKVTSKAGIKEGIGKQERFIKGRKGKERGKVCGKGLKVRKMVLGVSRQQGRKRE